MSIHKIGAFIIHQCLFAPTRRPADPPSRRRAVTFSLRAFLSPLLDPRPSTLLSVSLSILSAILLVASQPPVNLSPLAYIALVPLFLSLSGKTLQNTLRRNFFLGCVNGVVSYLGLVYWVVVAMHRYGGIDIFTSSLILLLLACYMALYTGIFTLSVTWLEKRLSIPFYLSAPALWTLLEYIRGFFLTGFPWSLLAHTQHNILPMIQIVAVTGTYFLSFLIVAVNAVIAHIMTKRKVPLSFTVVIAVLVAASLAYGIKQLSDKEDESMKAAIIQGNIAQDMKWDEAFKIRTVRTYYQRTVEAGRGADLIVWPETSMPFIFNDEPQTVNFIRTLPSLAESYLLLGTVSKAGLDRYHNSAYILDRKGEVAGVYHKAHLVPFGEYTPLLSYLPFLEKLTAAGIGFVPGEGHAPLDTAVGKMGILICYEGIFPYITNETVRKGAQVLINITNDAWYDRTSAPYQHLAFYVFRAVETDRYVLRSANTGISAIIDARGRIKGSTPIFVEATLKGGYALKDTITPYVRYGDYFAVIVFVFLLTVCGVRYGALRKKGA